MKTIVAIAMGALLFGAGLVGGWLLLGLYSGQQQVPANLERLSVEDFVSKPFTKMGMEFRLRNTGTAGLQIATVMMNGHLNQSIPRMSEGWNGTTALNPNQTALLYVYYPCYAQAFNDSIPYLSGSPTQTDMSNIEQWVNSFNCTFTFLTTTGYQYNFTVNRLGFDLYISLAIWQSGQTFSFLATEQGQVTNLEFTTTDITATFQNTGTTPITINEVWVNGVKQTTVTPSLPLTVDSNSQQAIVISYTVVSGYQYEVKLVSAKGNAFLRTGVAPV